MSAPSRTTFFRSFMNRSAHGIRQLAALTVLACIMAGHAFALDPNKTMTQFRHRSWGNADGIDKVLSIAQTQDGYLWIGTANQLFQFDGVTFVRWLPKRGDPDIPGPPTSILGSKDGSLWAGCANGVWQLKHGSSRLWNLSDGSPLTRVRAILETADGAIWFAGYGGLGRFSGGKLEIVGPEIGLPGGEFPTVAEDHQGTLWVAMLDPSQKRDVDGSFAVLPRGQSRFRFPPQRFAAASRLQVQNDGRIWAAEVRRSVRAFTNNGTNIEFQLPEIQVGSRDILFDRDGALWITTVGDGLRRIRDTRALGTNNVEQFSDRADIFTQKDGLSSDNDSSIFEDREGNIWVGTASGLDCFSENKITSFQVREGLPFDQNLVLQSAPDGSMWVGGYPQGFEQMPAARGSFINRKWFGLEADPASDMYYGVYCMLGTPQGQLLAGTGMGVFKLDPTGTGELLTWPGRLQFRYVQAMTVDKDGGLWLCDSHKDTYRVLGEEARHLQQIIQNVLVAHCDYAGRIWLGLQGGGLGLFESGQYTHNAAGTNGVLPGNIHAILSEPDGKVCFAGEGGISLFNGGRFQLLTHKNGLPTDTLFAAVKGNRGLYWFAGMDVIFSVTPENLQKALGSDGPLVCGQVLNFADGLRGFVRPPTDNDWGYPLATKGPDGRLWFATGKGLAVVNPESIPKNKIPPPVHVEKVVAGGTTYQNLASLQLPIGTRSCQIDYVGLSFVNPAKVRYRYKLDDQDFVDAGPNRQAFLQSLKPRKHKFQVIACNNDGVWNEKGDSVEFTILPAFYETSWFPALCALPVALAAWGLYRLRLARATARVKQQLEGQIKERKRIAQELHDTLLQGFTGIGLKLDAITARLPASLNETKEQLQKILDQSDKYLVEARRSVWELRSTSLEETHDFAKVLLEAGDRIVQDTGIRLSFSVNGEPRKLPAAMEDNLLRICEEAVTNAVKHARPTEVVVNLEFGAQRIILRIKDNGCGFDTRGPEAIKSGHFGLSGIQERARSLGGSAALSSQPGQGTQITISVDTM